MQLVDVNGNFHLWTFLEGIDVSIVCVRIQYLGHGRVLEMKSGFYFPDIVRIISVLPSRYK